MGEFETFEETVSELRDRFSIQLPTSHVNYEPITISTYGNHLHTDGGFLTIQLSGDATLFSVTGTADTVLWASNQESRINLGDGRDIVHGGAARDIVHAGGGDDMLFGGAGNDVLFGDEGDDFISAGYGSDRIYGGDGQDVLLASSGRNQLYGGEGADIFVLNSTPEAVHIIRDFNPDDGDVLVFSGSSNIDDFADFLNDVEILQSGQNVVIRDNGSDIILIDTDISELTETTVEFDAVPYLPEYATVEEYIASNLWQDVDEISIDGVIYHRRAGEPPHQDHKFQDGAGDWWSPDYLVVVAAGQSNMLGAGAGGDMTIDPNVVAYDWVNGGIVAADYGSAPAGGDGVRTGDALRNNLFFPFANELAASSGQPVLVIAHPVSGSQIQTWLDSGSGENWGALSSDIDAALEMVGQSEVDIVLWHQGESNHSIPTDTYAAMVLELIDQMRDAAWGTPDMNILIGELSRDGVNFVQNAALQTLELLNEDPNIGFVSSVGLQAFDASGVHFDGASLVEFGIRYFEVYQQLMSQEELAVPQQPNSAPTVGPLAIIPESITIGEGEWVWLDTAGWFTDLEGDQLYSYGYLDDRSEWWVRSDPEIGGVWLRPDFDAAGDYLLNIYASDFALDGETVSIALSVQEVDPGLEMFANNSWSRSLGYFKDFTILQQVASENRAITILDSSALEQDAPTIISVNSLWIEGSEGISGDFEFAPDVYRIYFEGDADFNATGAALDDYIVGNRGDNRLLGEGGDDRIYGGDGQDLIFGGSGNDKLYGDEGNDLIDGQEGRDVAYGGAGADTFVFEAGDEFLSIRDFDGEFEMDVIFLAGFDGITSYEDMLTMTTLRHYSDGIILDIGEDRLMINGLDVDELSSDFFVFA
ncbi:sialate O-acetylesterase [Marivivens marinus]|uniref:sialate O-acetylesterase n=1 Tax=Marivivens marinus TaxID=3110173 RepID=UPI003B847FDE